LLLCQLCWVLQVSLIVVMMSVITLYVVALLGHFTKHFCAKAEQLLRRSFLLLFMATTFVKIAPNYGARHKSCSLKHAIKFLRKWCWNRTASFVQFTLCRQLCTLHKLVWDIDSRKHTRVPNAISGAEADQKDAKTQSKNALWKWILRVEIIKGL
jgi:hypothetical protein